MTDFDTMPQESLPNPPQTQSSLTPSEILELKSKTKSGADWFLWIGILSLINSFVYLGLNDNWTFVVGLGFSQLVDSIGMYYGGNGKLLAIVVDLVAISIFVLFYWFSNKHYSWAFIAGTVLYSADTILVALVGDYLSTGFHLFALYWIIVGYIANRKFLKNVRISSVDA